MKFFTVFAAILSVALCSQASWTLHQLSEALQNPNTDPALLPHLENALNEMMNALHAGHQIDAIAVTIPAIDLSTWTLSELSEALQNPATDAALVPYLEQALNEMMLAIVSGNLQQVTPVIVPAMDVSSWTFADVNAALENPTTNPALLPYLEHALNEMMQALFAGEQMDSITIAIPAGLLPVADSPAPVPVVPAPVETPVDATPVETPVDATPVAPAPSSPLVQIIINVNQPAGSPVVPAPVIVEEAPLEIVDVMPVIVEEAPLEIVDVMPVIVDQTPIEIVEPVQVVETPAGIEPVIVGSPIIPVIVEPNQVVETPIAVEPVIIGAPLIPVA